MRLSPTQTKVSSKVSLTAKEFDNLSAIGKIQGNVSPLPSTRQHLSSDVCPQDMREDYQNCAML